MTMWEFPCSGPAVISISSWPSGSVTVSGEDTDTISVDAVATAPDVDADDLLAEMRVSFADGRLDITGPRLGGLRRGHGLDLTIKAPPGSNCKAHTASADVSCVGRLGELTLKTASGDITAVTTSGPIAVQTASGGIFIDQAGADVLISTASGDVQVANGHGEVRVKSASGDVAIGACAGPLVVQTTSGDIEVRELSSGGAELATMSGDAYVSVTPGIGVYVDLASTSGDVRSDLDEDASVTPQAAMAIKCRTLSGDIHIAKAAAGAPSEQSAPA